MSGGFYSIAYSVPDAMWLVQEHTEHVDAARQSSNRSSMGKSKWRGCTSNNVPWTEERVRKAVDMLHANLISNLGDAPAMIRRLGDAGYLPLVEAVES